jgi:hypothetical protein
MELPRSQIGREHNALLAVSVDVQQEQQQPRFYGCYAMRERIPWNTSDNVMMVFASIMELEL